MPRIHCVSIGKSSTNHNVTFSLREKRKVIENIYPQITDICLLKQEHTNLIYFAHETNKIDENTIGDAFIGCKHRQALVIQTADCLPIFMAMGKFRQSFTDEFAHCIDAEDTSPCIAAVHAGWRGLKNKIIYKTVLHMLAFMEKLREEYQLFFLVGPSICKFHYEVGEDFREKFPSFPEAFVAHPQKKGHLFFDMKYVAKLQIIAAIRNFYQMQLPGASPQIKKQMFQEEAFMQENCIFKGFEENCNPSHSSHVCTMNSTSNFYSHRRGEKGRNFHVIHIDKIHS